MSALELRADFPVLQRQVHGKPLVYLDTGASAQMPRAVLAALQDYQTRHHANIHRGVHALSQEATALYESARATVRGFINAPSTREVVFTRGTTEAINLVAQSYLRPRLQPGDEILITHLEHHANIVPWQLVAAATGARIRAVPLLADGAIDPAAFRQLLNARTRLIAVAHVSNALGTVLPLADIGALARTRGIPWLVDGAQAIAHQSVDVQALGCDFYAFSGHKIYAPTGIGVLYAREALLAAMPPWQGGGDMILTVGIEQSTWNELPFKFEAGTPNISGAIGLGAALDYVRGIGLSAIAAHEHRLATRAEQELAAIPGLRIIGTAPGKAAVISFVLDGIHPHDIGTILDAEGVAVRTGHHCAMPVMDFYGLPATARASFGCYNNDDDVSRLVAAVSRCREVFS
jgi:cysteine desulfurase / selenocysteine lyase